MRRIGYQDRAVECLIRHSKDYLSKQESKGDKIFYCVLQAITGSGKTVIASKYIERMSPGSELGIDDDIAYIWLSVGKGRLHIQSANKLRSYLPEANRVLLADEAVLCGRLNAGEVLVLNWELLNTKKIDKETGLSYFDNIFMRDGDRPNLRDLWESTRESGVKIVLIIDESHNTAGSVTSREIIDLINPAFIIELTATPDFKNDNPKGVYDYCNVKVSDVIDEGVIKKSIKINDTTDKENNVGILEGLLEQAIRKRKELARAYIDEGVDYINPLCLIQLPDGKEGNLLKEEVIRILHEKGVSFSNNNLAIWLADKKDKINLEDIQDMGSKVSYLIFKQAIATGWDCPRASILVKLRDTKSEVFDLQTIGRILRMPELKHYKNPILNDSYIYTNAEYTVNTGNYRNVLPLRQVLKEKFREDVLGMTFITEVVKRDKIDIVEKDLVKMFNIFIKDVDLKSEGIESMAIGSTDIDTDDFYKKSNTEVDLGDIDTLRVRYSVKDIDRLYKLLVNKLKSNMIGYNFIDNVLIRFFKKRHRGLSIEEVKRIILNNEMKLKEVFDKIKGEIRGRRLYYVEKDEFRFPVDRYANERDTVELDKCAYSKHFKSNYETESVFEGYLESNEGVLYWIKNGDVGKDSLSIAYKDDSLIKGFFPDYVVKFKNGGIGIFEVKDINDRDKNTVTPKKINALIKYCDKYNYYGGLVQIKDRDVCEDSLPAILKGAR